MTDQIDWRTKQPPQVARVLEDVKCWRSSWCSAHKAKDTTASIFWGREALKEEALDYLPWKERTRENHGRQPDEHWNCFKGNVWDMSERRAGAHNYGLFRAHKCHLERNWTELNCYIQNNWATDINGFQCPTMQKNKNKNKKLHSFEQKNKKQKHTHTKKKNPRIIIKQPRFRKQNTNEWIKMIWHIKIY